MHEIAPIITALGGLGGVATLLLALPQLRRIKHDSAAVREQVEPNHGSSLKDAVHRIEIAQDNIRDDMRQMRGALGHELGDFRRAQEAVNADVRERVARLEGKVLDS